MERLTIKQDGEYYIKTLNNDCIVCASCEKCEKHINQLVKILGAYEDTGLTPEEIEQLKDELNHAYDKSNTAVKGYYELKQSYEQLQKENADLIELLKIMYKDLIGKCSVCVVKDGDMRECFGCNKINPKWQWQHADKLKELGVKV